MTLKVKLIDETLRCLNTIWTGDMIDIHLRVIVRMAPNRTMGFKPIELIKIFKVPVSHFIEADTHAKLEEMAVLAQEAYDKWLEVQSIQLSENHKNYYEVVAQSC